MTSQSLQGRNLSSDLIQACTTGDLALLKSHYPGSNPLSPSVPPLAFLLYISTQHAHAPLISYLSSNTPTPWDPPLSEPISAIPEEWQVFFPSIPCAAVATGKPEIVSLYLSAGLDVNEKLEQAQTLLYQAVLSQSEAMAEYLLSQGADPNPGFARPEDSLLGEACELASVEMVRLLLDQGAKLEGSHALRRAARRGNVGVAGVLLEKGADVNEMFKLSKAIGEERVRDWGTALHFAAEDGRVEFAKWLLSKRADRKLRDWKGRTAGDVAREKVISELEDL